MGKAYNSRRRCAARADGGRGFHRCGLGLLADFHVPPALLALQAFAQRDGDRAGLRFAGQSGEFVGEPAGLRILDVQAHRIVQGQKEHLRVVFRARIAENLSLEKRPCA